MQQRVPDKINHSLIKTFTCGKLSERANGKLQYQLWQNDEDLSLGLAISSNESTGGFSSELIRIENILNTLTELHQRLRPFHATVLKDLFIGRSANNHCFLAAILVDQKVIQPHTQVSRLLEVHSDFELWTLALEDHLKNVDTLIQNFAQARETPIDQDTVKPKKFNKKNVIQIFPPEVDDLTTGKIHEVHQE